MTATLEQELERLIEDADYQVVIAHAGDNYLKLRILYLPRLSVKGEGAWSYIASGLIAERSFLTKNSARRWRRAAKWARAEITGHRELLRTVGA